MISLRCSGTDCGYETGDYEATVAVALLNNHTAAVHSGNAVSSESSRRAPRVERPVLEDHISEEHWNGFLKGWKMFVQANGIRTEDQAVQLFACCEGELRAKVTCTNENVLEGSVDEMLELFHSLAVVPVAISVQRSDLLQMQQSAGESIRTFFSRVRGKALTCRFQLECKEAHAGPDPDRHVYINYTNEIIRHVLIAGLYDEDIRRDVFGVPDVDKMALNDLVSFIEGKEVAREATMIPSVNLVSQFKRGKRDSRSPPLAIETNQGISKEGKCIRCSKLFPAFKRMANGKVNKKAFRECAECWRKGKFTIQTISQGNDSAAVTFDISLINGGLCTVKENLPDKIDHHTDLSHYVFENGAWERKSAKAHPRVDLTFSTEECDYVRFGYPCPGITGRISAIADSGAQCCVWGLGEFLREGFTYEDLIPVRQGLSAVSRSGLKILGAVFLRLSGFSEGNGPISCGAFTYVSSDVSGFYLSQNAMLQLRIVSPNFPSVGAADVSLVSDYTPNLGFSECSCPKRSLPPGLPDKLPFAATEDNIERMKQWLLDHYSGSTFNTCPHQILPEMTGPSVEIHIDPKAKPTSVSVPGHVPLHWQDQVEKDLIRDENLGVIERVPHGQPSSWCHRMVVTRKGDGSPRRTVDLSPLNRHCIREVHTNRSPFELARGVPANTWRTVTDAWNGYHSVPLRPADRHLTTFITPLGRYRYLRAPQGFASSGDGYNRRFDEIMADFEGHKRCVDDTLIYDSDLERHWWRVLEFLELVGSAGIVLNPTKFQFCQKQVDFAGFRISDVCIEPLPKYLDAIRGFPTPRSTTDIRSWFGLVHQVSHYAQLRDIMSPFKSFLSPKVKFYWDDELQQQFTRSKELIVQAICDGVQIFDASRRTCLRADWSRQGLGYYLSQKYCNCEGVLPNCCLDGWKITLCGSRFLHQAEQRYAPIEGEALAVAWALEQTKFFTMGCDDLLVVTDHKPLVKILGDRQLDDIPNTRLFRLKQRTLPWKFSIVWLPGKDNWFADATSRHPVDGNVVHVANEGSMMLNAIFESEGDLCEHAYMASIKSGLNNVKVVTWEKVKEATQIELSELLKYVVDGFPDSKESLPPGVLEFWCHKEGLYVFDGVVLYNDRVVIPPCLRKDVLLALHSAHQGISGMTLNAQETVFWPGISKDIELERLRCHLCTQIAPSQPKTLPFEPHVPSTPFEAIVADYFQHQGFYYLVVADRLTGWPEVYRIRVGTEEAGARGLLALLKRYFGSFGVPVEVSNDGGPEFKANHTQDFFARWGIRCRMSSAYHPQSNGRAEVAVKSVKRLLGNSIGSDGGLDTEKFMQAILMYRNTPDPTCGISPSEMVFGRKLRDTLPRLDKSKNVYLNHMVSHDWREAWAAKECALRSRGRLTNEKLSKMSMPLVDLAIGDRVAIQNQCGNKPKRWDRTGVVLERRNYDQYVIKVDGSGRLTVRNRRFLKRLLQDRGLYGTSPQKRSSAPASVDLGRFKSTSALPPRTDLHVPSHPTDRDYTFVSDPSVPLNEGLSHRSSDSGASFLADRSFPNDLPPIPANNGAGSLPMMQPVGDGQAGLSDAPMMQPVGAGPSDAPVVMTSRKSGRVRIPRKVYEPESGRYVLPTT